MEKIDLGTIVQQAIAKFNQNRIGQKPPVFIMISGSLPHVPWHDRSLKEFARLFLYESLATSDPDAVVEVAVRRKTELKDLNQFVGIHPSYWIQMRVSGRGLRIMERLIEDLFADLGYLCEEWVGAEDSSARLGIFGAADKPEAKMVFCLETSRDILKCDLLLPIYENFPVPCLIANERKDKAAARV
ncbi:MAG TPA: hypothetical protein VMO00_07590 [Methylomirabilota bacterium]|nr:hypothetical protein [Methylomirabilota bacterium]